MSHSANRIDVRGWLVAAVQVNLLTYAYVFLDWLFFVTKPSFMSVMRRSEQVSILMTVSVGYSALGLIPVGVLALPEALSSAARAKRILAALRSAIPAMILASLALIALDILTYTVFGFGVVSTEGVWRLACAVLFLILFAIDWREARRDRDPPRSVLERGLAASIALVVASFLFIIVRFAGEAPRSGIDIIPVAHRTALPDIILFGADGLEATHVQAYGYGRQTSPRLTELKAEALGAENAFPKAGNGAGSIASLLTGRLPTETALILPPDILRREAA